MLGNGIRQFAHDTTPYLILLIFVATLGSSQFGFHLAELNAPQDVITCHKKTVSVPDRLARLMHLKKDNEPSSGLFDDCIPMSDAAFATISSIFTLGGLAGALGGGPWSSKRGRVPAMFTTAGFYMLGAALETLANSVWLMATGRFFAGVGAGASTVIVPLYISEIAPPKERGLFGAMTQISINIGILVSQTLGYFLSYGTQWRWILSTGFFIATAQMVGLFLAPESPSWVASNGDAMKAKRTLQRIRGKGFDITEETEAWNEDGDGSGEEDRLLAQPEESIAALGAGTNNAVHLGFVQVVRDPLCRPAIVAVIGIMFAQQLCGINSIIVYSVSLLKDLLPFSAALLNILVSLVNLGTTIACSPLPDRLGRKTCLLLSIVGQGTSSLILALSILFDLKFLSAVAVLFFVGFFAVGLGPVPFILASEMVGQEAVGATQSWCLGANYVATFLVVQFFPLVNNWLNNWLGGHGWVYFIFAALAGLSALFVSWKVPETKGKKDVDEVWGRTRRVD